MAEYKSHNLVLYAADNHAVVGFKVQNSAGVSQIEGGSVELKGSKVSLVNDIDSSYSFDHLGKKIFDNKAELDAKNVSQDALIAATESAIATETSTRATEFNALQNAIVAEVGRAATAEGALQAAIDDEAARRINGDLYTQGIIATEATNRATAISGVESSLAASLAQKTTDFQAADTLVNDRIDAILAGSAVDFDTLKEITDAYQLADTSITATITSLQSSLADLVSRFDTAFPETAP